MAKNQKKQKKRRTKDKPIVADAATDAARAAQHNTKPGSGHGPVGGSRPPPEITDQYLRVEGLNIGAVIGDTAQLSVARGASLLLRQAIADIAEPVEHKGEPLRPADSLAISTGASVGEFLLPGATRQQAEQIAANITEYLTSPVLGYHHLTFGVCVEGYRPGAGELEVRERALARLRFGQLRTPTSVPPPLNQDASLQQCGWEGRRPADAPGPISIQGEDDIRVSTSVWDRWSYGRDQKKQGFYRSEARLAPDHPAYSLGYSNDLGDLADEPRAGGLSGKVAVIYADGNRFSQIRTKTCKRFKALEKFDLLIRDRRSAYLSALLQRMASDDSFRTGSGRLRLETLLWGGDELKLVVPAWCGFAVLQHLFATFTGWEYKQWPLTHAAGIVFCHAKTPIQRSMALAEQLANGVKTRQKTEARGKGDDLLRSQLHDQYDYMVLESIDFPIEDDLTAHWSGCYQAASPLRRPLAPIADWPRIEAEVASLLDDFPKGQVYAIARAAVASAWSGDATQTGPYRAALQRMHQVTDTKRTSTLIERMGRLFDTTADLKIGAEPVPDPWTWIHLAEFWDYLAPRIARRPVDTAPARQTGAGDQR